MASSDAEADVFCYLEDYDPQAKKARCAFLLFPSVSVSLPRGPWSKTGPKGQVAPPKLNV